MNPTQPKERPILFSGPMVRAILEGRKTQTRRIVKPQPEGHHWEAIKGYTINASGPHLLNTGLFGVRFLHQIPQNKTGDSVQWATCKQGKPGDRLWVRETWQVATGLHDGDLGAAVRYRDGNVKSCWMPVEKPMPLGLTWNRWRPSIHMPRWASRITLEIVAVRVERLQDITRGDAMDEGCPHSNMAYGPNPIDWYSGLWNSINGPGSWDINPWVWVVQFKAVNTKASDEPL